MLPEDSSKDDLFPPTFKNKFNTKDNDKIHSNCLPRRRNFMLGNIMENKYKSIRIKINIEKTNLVQKKLYKEFTHKL